MVTVYHGDRAVGQFPSLAKRSEQANDVRWPNRANVDSSEQISCFI